MTGASLGAGLAIGAIMLAAWLDLRLGDKRPSDPMRRILHGGAAFVILEVAVGVLAYFERSHASEPALMAVLFTVFLPALAYAFLTGLWLLRTLAELARFARR